MATSIVVYQGNLRTKASHIQSGESLITDAPTDNHGLGSAFSPTDLVATALAQCMMTLMGIAAASHEINFDQCRAEVTKEMVSNPRRIAAIKINFVLGNNLNERQRIILEKAAISCPVAHSLHPDVAQEVSFTYNG